MPTFEFVWVLMDNHFLLLISLFFILAIAMIIAILWIGWVFTRLKDDVSPYTGLPLRRGKDLSYNSIQKIYKYMSTLSGYDNQMFKVFRSCVCRDTGRIFPNCITWYGRVRINWSFIKNRYRGEHRGSYISWGSLSHEEKEKMKSYHSSLEGYQTEFSSSRENPSDVEKEYVFKKPGPLYIDPKTGILIGWKCIPDSEFEVLVVQRPNKRT